MTPEQRKFVAMLRKVARDVEKMSDEEFAALKGQALGAEVFLTGKVVL